MAYALAYFIYHGHIELHLIKESGKPLFVLSDLRSNLLAGMQNFVP